MARCTRVSKRCRPEERAIFERLREKLAQKYPGQDLDSLVANALNRAETFSSEVKVQFKVPGAGLGEAPVAWGGAAGTAPVPSGFETVTGLGGRGQKATWQRGKTPGGRR